MEDDRDKYLESIENARGRKRNKNTFIRISKRSNFLFSTTVDGV